MNPAPLSFWHVGGSVIARGGIDVTEDMGRQFLAIFGDELRAAVAAGKMDEARGLSRLTTQLIRARLDARRWHRAASPVFLPVQALRAGRPLGL